MGFGGKGKRKGKGGKGKGKGKGGKGKGKRQASSNRKELRGITNELFQENGADKHAQSDNVDSRYQGLGRRVSRKTQRKQLKEAKKDKKRAHNMHLQQQKHNRLGAAQRADAAERNADARGGKGKRGGQSDKQAPPKKRRRRDDDEEITSEEEGGLEGNAKNKKSRSSEESEDEDENDEGDDGEEGEEEDFGEEEEEEEEEEEDDGSDGFACEKEAHPVSVSGGYVPPHLRGVGRNSGKSESPDLMDLKRQLRGIMNKVTEGNLDPSGRELCQSLEQLVPKAGVVVVADALMNVLVPAAVGDPDISVLVIGCYAALACVAHVRFGASFGGAVLQNIGSMLRRRLCSADASDEPTGEDARVGKNCVILLSLLFSFGLFPGSVIFDLVRHVFSAGRTSEARVELALTILRFAGKSLRADCVEDFKETLKYVTEAASGARSTTTDQDGSSIRTRIDYLLRELQDLKNNKVSFAVMDRFNQTRGWLQSSPLLNRKKIEDHQLSVPFKFLEEDAPEGWPLKAGSAGFQTSTSGGMAKATAEKDSLRAAAIEQRLSTELRQSLFVALMGAEDFDHAADRLYTVAVGAKSGLSEACLVIFHCAVREKTPNPFYEHVSDTLCARPAPWGKKFVHCFKRAAVQHLQEAHRYGLRAAVNLAELCAALIILPSASLPLATIRFMKFGEAALTSGGNGLSGVLGVLLRHLADSLLRRLPDAEATVAVFGPIKQYEDVREGMLLVLDGLVKPKLPKPSKQQSPDIARLWDNFKAARKELAAQSRR